MKMPGILWQSNFESRGEPQAQIEGGCWVRARPLPFYSIRNRLKATWLVFTGQADAFIWNLFDKGDKE